ncbi:hypothetical protein SHO565_58760 [Streptomyces sp. HO565]
MSVTVEKRQIGVFAACATVKGRALVVRELYLPKSRPQDAGRCRGSWIAAGVQVWISQCRFLQCDEYPYASAQEGGRRTGHPTAAVADTDRCG